MPRNSWSTEPSAVVGAFGNIHPDAEAGALLMWAFDSAESLHYLGDIDDAYERSRSVPGNHRAEIVDVAHARWATTTSITALDLAAAALARSLGGHPGPREFDLGSFASPSKDERIVLNRMPSDALAWASDVLSDPRYQLIKDARDALVHRRPRRHHYAVIGSPEPDPRLDLSVGGNQVPVGTIIHEARDVATFHLEKLLSLLPHL